VISLEDAAAVVLGGCSPLPPHRLTLATALGCVLAEDVVATELVPPFANSAMDGYAVRAADVATVPVELPVAAEIAAGHPARSALGPGEAMRIFTGAPIPDGADAIVIVEHTERVTTGSAGLDVVRIHQQAVSGVHIRPAGDDLQPGDRLAGRGDEITPARLGLLRTVGVNQLMAYPRPWVGVISTGDELVAGPEELRPGQIRDSNRPMLLALVEQAGFKPVDLGHVPDDENAIAEAIETAGTHCDALLSTGGVSMGDADLVKVVLDRLAGAESPMRWMQVTIKPAKPLAVGVVRPRERAMPVFGLPGNPVSAFVSFELFARPGLRKLAGHPPERWRRAPLAAVAQEDIRRRSDGKTHFVRVVAEAANGQLSVRPLSRQGSHQLAGLAQANALAIVPDGDGVATGDPLEVLLLDQP
jgi:molybdenum cofactor synthesis domain-containing protein